MNNDYTSLFCIVGVVLIGLLIWLFTYLVKKGQEETHRVETQQMMILQGLPQDKQMIFSIQFTNIKKSTSTALLLALFLGGIGAHKFYMGQTGAGIIYLLFCWTGIPALIALFEAFGMATTVSKYNLQKAQEIAMMVGGRAF